MAIDEEAAVVVREIFQMVSDGMLIANIVKILNDSGIESPMVHNARVGHKVWPAYENKWLFCSVKRILRWVMGLAATMQKFNEGLSQS